MYYRSYGLLLLVLASLVATQTYRDDMVMGFMVGGLILGIDLPLRFLGHIAPWRNDDVTMWYLSPYRGSHIFVIPTWLVGAFLLGLGLACNISPDLARRLDTPLKDREQANANKDAKAPEPPPPAPKGSLELAIEETAPYNGTRFRYTLNNRTGGVINAVTEIVRYPQFNGEEAKSSIARPKLGPSDTRSEEVHVFGPAPPWLRVTITGVDSVQKPIQVEKEWKRPK